MTKTILFVDDEPQILKALRRSFIDSNFAIRLANSGLEALEIIKNEHIDMVISDMRMPQMDGYELLKQVKALDDSIVRIILSGYTDEKIVYKALLNNLAKSYLFKPWNNDDLNQMIGHVFEVKSMLSNPALTDLILKQEDLPAPRSTYFQLVKLIEKDASSEEISHIIEMDQSISSKVLRISNSAFYGIKTSSIKQAITYIGLNNIKDIVLSCSIFENLKINKELIAYRNELWRHTTLSSFYISALYAKVLNSKMPVEAFTAGILHDIGKMVLIQIYPEVAGKAYQALLRKEPDDALEIETSDLGFNHQMLGGFLLEWWDFPFAIVEATLFHHEPLNPSIVNKTLVGALHIADQYALKYMGFIDHIRVDLNLLDQLKINFTEMDYVLSHLQPETSHY